MNFIQFRGSPTKVTFVYRDKPYTIHNDKSETMFVMEYGGFVKKAPYDNQFIFQLPSDVVGPSYMCSCGSPAVFVGSNQYKTMGSPEGMMAVCQAHLDTLKHADGSS